MTAKPSRLTKNRHGTYCLRWIVPVRLRKDGSPREIRFSLRTTDPCHARILALEFNLALERVRHMTRDNDPRLGVTPMTVTIGDTKWDIRDDTDRRLFDQLLKDNPDVRQALLQSIRSGVAPADAMAALVDQVKANVAAVAPVANPMLLTRAIELFAESRGALNQNARGTANEKARTMHLLQAHLVAHGRPLGKTYVHEVRRDELVDFVDEYAKRPGKASGVEATSETLDATDDSSIDDDVEPLSPRTVTKAIGHLENFFVYALSKNWVAATPLDDAFHDATAGLRKSAAGAKRANSYEPFTDAEIQEIFDPVRYLRNLRDADDFWAPLIALFTGARLGEIVTLRADDITFHNEHGMFLMRVRKGSRKDTAQRGGSKNANSVRLVPIPKALFDLGLIQYVHHVQKLGATALFPNRKVNETRKADPSKHVSRIFGEHLDAIGLASPSKVFHSFRHCVVTRLHVHGTPVGDAELIVGHAAQDAHLRLSTAAGHHGGRSSTHIRTYVDAGSYAQGSLYMRLKLHLENSLHYPLDFERLRLAALIVKELTVKKDDGSYTSGWHTNNHSLSAAMLKRLEDAPTCAAVDAPDSPQVVAP